MKFHIFLHTFIAPEVASHDFNGESLLHACAKRNEELLKRCAWEPLCCVPVWGTSSPCWRCRCKRVFCLQPRTWCEGRLRWALACWQSWYQLLKGEKPPVLVGVLEQYVTSDLIAIIEGDVLFSYCFLNLVKNNEPVLPWSVCPYRDDPLGARHTSHANCACLSDDSCEFGSYATQKPHKCRRKSDVVRATNRKSTR